MKPRTLFPGLGALFAVRLPGRPDRNPKIGTRDLSLSDHLLRDIGLLDVPTRRRLR
ncbi:MAG: hypothetical protein H6891_07350 [Brucellaceae bacterium]|nr:hypothetical protein [Brucellaceae bacterium]